ncbi:DUF456 family protein [Paenibacillus aurantius]|uniref:DUF456 family protein n=1 Tax=Paenibacillus aurantius TaxID=2918900 RepID=A0AA96LF58_9BACL|nr:DUF456 family protein [Paenibacillus aurantius]WJH32242.1 DUF456 family protein [Paenibacillus sp. CC-CFT747]WNQ12621.1 DUF456 family protein [Paenibacillus aurantius]
MEWAAWILVIALFVIGMIGTVYPILPSVVAVYAAFFVYGFMVSFQPFGFWFWALETSIFAAIFVGDYVISALGVKKFGGSRASVVGSTIGLIVGPFVIPFAGLIIGPFAGAVAGELLAGSDIQKSLKVGVGSLVGFFSSMIVKIILQLIMILLFILWVL